MLKKWMAALPALVLVFLCACGLVPQAASDDQTESLMLEALSALEANDADAFHALFVPGILPAAGSDEFTAQFADLRSYYQGTLVEYRLSGITRNSSTSGGATTLAVECNYTVLTSLDTYHTYVTRRQAPGEDGLYSFNLVTQADYEALMEASTPTGGLGTLGSFTAGQWLVFAFSLAVYGFTLFTLVRCLRDAIRLKPLFVLVVLVQFTLNLTLAGGGFEFAFRPGLLGLSHLLLYPDGDMVLTACLPAGAIVYWFIRKSLPAPAAPPQPQAQQEDDQEV